MATVLLLTATYVKDYTFVDPNVDEKYIRIAIEEAQKIHIRNYIGSGLYNEIISQVETGTLTALNTTLLNDYIIPALKWWVMVEAAPFLTYKVTNKNIVRKNSESSSGVDSSELNNFMDLVTDKAQYHTNRLIEYLLQYASSYPLYDNPGSGFDTIVPQLYAYDEGIFLGRNKRYISYEEKFEKRKRY